MNLRRRILTDAIYKLALHQALYYSLWLGLIMIKAILLITCEHRAKGPRSTVQETHFPVRI